MCTWKKIMQGGNGSTRAKLGGAPGAGPPGDPGELLGAPGGPPGAPRGPPGAPSSAAAASPPLCTSSSSSDKGKGVTRAMSRLFDSTSSQPSIVIKPICTDRGSQCYWTNVRKGRPMIDPTFTFCEVTHEFKHILKLSLKKNLNSKYVPLKLLQICYQLNCSL